MECFWLVKHVWKSESESHLVMSNSLQPHGLYSPWNSPGQDTGVGSLLQGIFPTQRSNPGSTHYRQILYQLSHKVNPIILEPKNTILSPGDRSDPGIGLGSPTLQVDLLPTELSGKPETCIEQIDSASMPGLLKNTTTIVLGQNWVIGP